MQRYNGVIEGEHAKKCFLEIGEKWIFSTHGQNFRGGIQLHGNKQKLILIIIFILTGGPCQLKQLL